MRHPRDAAKNGPRLDDGFPLIGTPLWCQEGITVPGITVLPGLRCHFENDPPDRSGSVLAVVSHGSDSAEPVLRMGYPALHISVPEARTTGQVEVWRTGHDVVSGYHDGLAYAHDGHYLFCGGRTVHDENYSTATENMYVAAFDLIERLGYSEVARMWNVVGGITTPVRGCEDADRYGVFCRARARAFRRRGLAAGDMPAATGIGGRDGHTTVHLVATRSRDVVRIENPRQVPAYQYPDRYGIESPSFARAAFVRSERGFGDLFISGTASIVGHETVHHGDVERQTRTTLENIAELVSGANLFRHGIHAEVGLRDIDCVKVYVKHRRDLDTVSRICTSALGPRCQVVYTIADVCRKDLLVEIEGFVSVRDRRPATGYLEESHESGNAPDRSLARLRTTPRGTGQAA
jgi:chorismate lyase / 3-hydroxybenzoate synthase